MQSTHSTSPVLVPFDAEIERTLTHLRQSTREASNTMAQHPDGVPEYPPRTSLLEHYILGAYSSPSGIHLSVITADHFEIKPSTIQMLPIFHGVENENPYKHLDEFKEMCSTVKMAQFSDDALRLKLFPFSLKDRAKH